MIEEETISEICNEVIELCPSMDVFDVRRCAVGLSKRIDESDVVCNIIIAGFHISKFYNLKLDSCLRECVVLHFTGGDIEKTKQIKMYEMDKKFGIDFLMGKRPIGEDEIETLLGDGNGID